MEHQPLAQMIGDRPSTVLAQSLSTDCIELLLACLGLDVVEGSKEHERVSRDFAALVLVQFVELSAARAPCSRSR